MVPEFKILGLNLILHKQIFVVGVNVVKQSPFVNIVFLSRITIRIDLF